MNNNIQALSFEMVPRFWPELTGIRREEESLIAGFNGIPARMGATQAAGKQEEVFTSKSSNKRKVQ